MKRQRHRQRHRGNNKLEMHNLAINHIQTHSAIEVDINYREMQRDLLGKLGNWLT